MSFAADDTNYQFNFLANGNCLIGTTTDAGYKLDVNGTARVSGASGVPALDIRSSNTNFALMSILGNQTGDVNWLLMSGYPVAGDFTIRQSDTVDALTIKRLQVQQHSVQAYKQEAKF